MAWEKRQGIMLCQPLDERNLERNFKISETLMVQPKLDGVRCWVDWFQDEQIEDSLGNWFPMLISSQGNVFHNLGHIYHALRVLARETGERPHFDGELYRHGMPFEEIVSAVKRNAGNPHKDEGTIQFHIFDLKEPEVTNAEREIRLTSLLKTFKEESSYYISEDLQKVPTYTSMKETLGEYSDKFIAEGYEGIIVRNPLAFYVEKRPFTILKWKPSKADWYRVAGTGVAVAQDGTYHDRVGYILCEDRYGNRFKVGMGQGITHEKAREIWQDAHHGTDFYHKYVKVTYQNLTQNGVPRFGKAVEISEENPEEW